MKLLIKILLIALWVSLTAGAAVLMGFANQNHELKKCSGLDVKMDYSGSEPMFTVGDIKMLLTNRFGKFEQKALYELEIENIQNYLKKNPYVDYSDVHTTVGGRLVVEVRQCKPVVRIIDMGGANYYLDEKGKLVPANPEYPVRVVIASGNIVVPVKAGKSIYDQSRKPATPSPELTVLRNLHSMALMMKKDSVLDALIEQVNVKPDGKMQLVTKAGMHVVEFGDTVDATEKFENLKAFYKFGLTKTGWDRYKKINITYKNQVVCTK